MNRTYKASVGAGLAVALGMIGLTASNAAAAPEQCGYYSDSTGTARYANCITDAVIIRVEHQGDHPGEDQCVDGREDAYLGPTTEIKWAWAIGGSPGNHC